MPSVGGDEYGLRVAELSHRKRVPGARLVWLFRAAPTPVLACVACLWGPSVEELSAEELDVADPHLPLVACAYTEKAR